MKFLKLFLLIFSFSIILDSCGKKASKEQVLEFYAKVTDYVSSEEFNKILLSHKSEKDFENSLEKKMLEFAQAMGFQSLDEMKALDKVLDSPEILAAEKKYEEALSKAIQKVAGQISKDEMKGMESEAKHEAKPAEHAPSDAHGEKPNETPKHEEPTKQDEHKH